jgi:hypothetical protein
VREKQRSPCSAKSYVTWRISLSTDTRFMLVACSVTRPVKKAKHETTIALNDVVRGTRAVRRALRELRKFGRIGLEQNHGWTGYIARGDTVVAVTREYATKEKALHALIRSQVATERRLMRSS